MLNDKENALLRSKLQVPMVVRDILDEPSAIEDDTHYGLHEIISDLQPDSALLCIALAAKQIAALSVYQSSTLKVLNMECDRIISDYGPLWLRHAENSNIDEADVLDTLANICEDLEGIAELLEINTDFLRDHDEKSAVLCNILHIQASAHALIAEEFIGVLDSEEEEVETQIVETSVEFHDNVVPFPGTVLITVSD